MFGLVVRFAAVALVGLGLSGCAMVVGGIVGAALTPLVQPQADRILGVLGLDFLDPSGVDAVKKYDAGLLN